jgi:hypothetical protein
MGLAGQDREQPAAEPTIFQAASDGGNAGRVQLAAGFLQIIPGLGRVLGVKPGLFEQRGIEDKGISREVPADAPCLPSPVRSKLLI